MLNLAQLLSLKVRTSTRQQRFSIILYRFHGERTSLRLSTMTVSNGSFVSADLGVDQTASTLGMTIGLRCSCSITWGILVVSPSVSTKRTERPAKL